MKHFDTGVCRQLLKPGKGLMLLCFLISATVSASGCAGPGPERSTAGSVLENTSEDTRQQKIFEQLEAAMASGKGEVTIHADETPGVCQDGDLVMVDFTARLENGDLLATTIASVADDDEQSASLLNDQPRTFRPTAVLAGVGADLPGLADGVLGMQPGETKMMDLPPEKAFGISKPEDIQNFPVVKHIPKTVRIGPREYVERFQRFPVQDQTILFNPYLSGRIVAVDENQALLSLAPVHPEAQVVEEPFGKTNIREEGQNYVLTLTPQVGAVFEMESRKGRITAADGEQFRVDFNHPLAGKTLRLEMYVRELVKSSAARSVSMDWIGDYQQGVQRIKTEQKPMVLFLYADWCQWCEKLKKEVFTDPRITCLADRFVWVRINSDVHREYKEAFEQKSYPMLLVLDPKEAVISSFEGFKDATGVRAMLLHSMDRMEVESTKRKAQRQTEG